MTEATTDQRFDVFLSHNSKDKPAVIELASKLKDKDLKVWLDIWELLPGCLWSKTMEDIIRTTRTALVLVGKDGIGPWEDMEMCALLEEFVKRGMPVIPVVLPDCPRHSQLPIFLKQFGWVDLRDGTGDHEFQRLVRGIKASSPSPQKNATNTGGSPRLRNVGVPALMLVGVSIAVLPHVTPVSAPAAPKLQFSSLDGQPLTGLASFPVGWRLHFKVTVNQDAYVECFLRNQKNEVFHVFPTAEQPDGLLKAGLPLAVPAANISREILFNESSHEEFGCVASVQPPITTSAMPLGGEMLGLESRFASLREKFKQTSNPSVGWETLNIESR